MGDLPDHGKKKNSTSFLMDMLNSEETLPDHLLSADSTVRKKREAKKFFEEVVYLAVLKSIRLYQEIIAILSAKTAENTKKYVTDINLNDLARLQTRTSVPMRKMSDEDHQHLKASKEKYLQLMANIDSKINAVKERIALQKQTIINLEHRTSTMRKELVQEWEAFIAQYAADPDFLAIKISLPISDEYQTLKINKHAYLNVLQQITEILKAGDTPTYKIYDLISAKAHVLIAHQLQEDFAHLRADVRQDLINQYKNIAMAELTEQLWLDISLSPSLAQKFDEMYRMEHALAEAQAKLVLCEDTLNSLLDIKQKAEDQMAAIDALLNKTHMPAEQILNLDSNLERLNQQMTDLDRALSGDLNVIDSMRNESETILQDFKEVKLQACAGFKSAAKRDDNLTTRLNHSQSEAEDMLAKHAVKEEKAVVNQAEELTPTPLSRP